MLASTSSPALERLVAAREALYELSRMPEASDIDGFVTALTVGPSTQRAEDWLDLMWRDAPPERVTDRRIETLRAALSARRAEILEQLRGHGFDYTPQLDHDAAGRPDATGWANGFVRAMEFESELWGPVFDDDNVGVLLLPILARARNPRSGRPLFDIDRRVLSTDVSPHRQILVALQGIAAFWQTLNGGASAAVRARPQTH